MTATSNYQKNLIKANLEKSGSTILQNESLAKYTSMKIGGPADFFARVSEPRVLNSLFVNAAKLDIPVFVLGMGTNVLIGDKGYRGLVIKNEVTSVEVGIDVPVNISKSKKFRREEKHWNEGFLKLSDIDFDISSDQGVEVEVSAGTPLSYVIRTLLNAGITGLEYFSGIPGTFGGAIWNNIHGAEWLIEDFLHSVDILLPDGKIETLSKEELGFHYDYSIFHEKEAIILSAKLHLPYGNVEQAIFVANEWKKRKSFQPKNSAGCAFLNISEADKDMANLDNCATGYIVDRILKLKGKKVGGAWISNSHGNFIEVEKGAKASDVVALLDHIRLRTYAELGIMLEEEIVRIGEF